MWISFRILPFFITLWRSVSVKIALHVQFVRKGRIGCVTEDVFRETRSWLLVICIKNSVFNSENEPFDICLYLTNTFYFIQFITSLYFMHLNKESSIPREIKQFFFQLHPVIKCNGTHKIFTAEHKRIPNEVQLVSTCIKYRKKVNCQPSTVVKTWKLLINGVWLPKTIPVVTPGLLFIKNHKHVILFQPEKIFHNILSFFEETNIHIL